MSIGSVIQSNWRDGLKSLSLANLLLLAQLEFWTSPVSRYFLQGYNRDGLLSWFVALLLLTGLVFGVVRWSRRSPVVLRIVSYLALPVTLVAANQFRRAVGLWAMSSPLFAMVGLILVLIVVTAWLFRPAKALRIVSGICLFWIPLVPVALVTAAWSADRPDTALALSPRTPKDLKAPVIWVIFDELDQGWTFDHRPKGLELPHFDALRQQSLYCSNVSRPGPETLLSLPSLTTGQSVIAAEPSSQNALRLHLANGKISNWEDTDSVFDDMKRVGRQSAISGFFHNYSEVFEKKAVQISDEPAVTTGFLPTFELQWWLYVPTKLRSDALAAVGSASPMNMAATEQHWGLVNRQKAHVEDLLNSRHASFLFLHYGAPHGPWVMDTSGRHAFSSDMNGYFGNLVLTDQLLGQLMKDLKDRGLWDQTTLLVSSDHNLRGPIHGAPMNTKVPLLLKLPNQATELDLKSPVHATDERALLRACASGMVSTPEQASKLLSSLAGVPPIPWRTRP